MSQQATSLFPWALAALLFCHQGLLHHRAVTEHQYALLVSRVRVGHVCPHPGSIDPKVCKPYEVYQLHVYHNGRRCYQRQVMSGGVRLTVTVRCVNRKVLVERHHTCMCICTCMLTCIHGACAHTIYQRDQGDLHIQFASGTAVFTVWLQTSA